MTISGKSERRIQSFLKRLIDVAGSLVALILLGPLLIILAVLVRFKLGSPVLFRQQRPGLNGKPFTIYKFRTMTEVPNSPGKIVPDAERLLYFGKFLRSISLDELPELFNVLRGDMSLVGPRPLMTKYLDRYTPYQARRHEVRPGITGWAQVNGRNIISWEQKFDFDVWYVDNWSILLDFKIIFRSIGMVFKRSGITQEGRATVDEFMGTNKNIDECSTENRGGQI